MSETAVDTGTETGAETPEAETKARDMGWRPRDEWEGDDSGWMEADAFIERQDKRRAIVTEEVKAESEKLKSELAALKAEHAETKQTIEDFKGFQTKIEEAAYKRALKDLQAQQKAAVESGDTEAFDSAAREIGELVDDARKPAEQKPFNPAEIPAFRDFRKVNKWYGNDYEMSAYANQIGPMIMRNENLSGDDAEYYDRIGEEVRKKFPDAFENKNRKRASSVEEPGGSDGGKKKGNGVADLPAEAKATGERFVKQGLFKDLKEYAKDYFAQEE